MCVGKGTKNGASTLLRIPPGCHFDPNNPDDSSPPLPTVRLSGLFCYYNARNIHGPGGSGEGAVVAYALDAVMKYGVLPEAMYPDTDAYQQSYSDADPPVASDYAEAIRHVVAHAARITSKAQYFDFLAQGYPIIDGVPISQGWMTTADDGRFLLGGRSIGGHCTLTVGYDRRTNRLIKRNSWEDWGAVTADPQFGPQGLGGDAGGRDNIGYCALDEYEATYLDDADFASGSTDAFVINDVPGFAAPKIAPISATELFA
jgi:hypothetical protein